MTFAVIVQARMGSSRLPGKVLEPLGERSALARCLNRCAMIPGVDVVVCATPAGSQDNLVADEAAQAGAIVVRGSEHDVLSRYADAARAVDATVVMRVTSDCPFIDPQVCGRVYELLMETGGDYACNTMPPRFPHGLDYDVFHVDHLYEAERLALDPDEREHVTIWLKRNTALKRAALVGPGGGVERLRWTLDHSEDLAFCRGVFEEMGEAAAWTDWRALARFCVQHPEIAAINMRRTDEARLAAAPPSAGVTSVAA